MPPELSLQSSCAGRGQHPAMRKPVAPAIKCRIRHVVLSYGTSGKQVSTLSQNSFARVAGWLLHKNPPAPAPASFAPALHPRLSITNGSARERNNESLDCCASRVMDTYTAPNDVTLKLSSVWTCPFHYKLNMSRPTAGMLNNRGYWSSVFRAADPSRSRSKRACSSREQSQL